MWQAFSRYSAGWAASYRQSLLSHYIGFPLWDCLIFPTVALGQLPQFTPIGVSQFSPVTARALPTPPAGKLKGVTLHHFGGFLDASWRENDYLWGRLDAAELILRTLRRTGQPPSGQADNAEVDASAAADGELKPALNAIMTSENDLSRIPAADRDLIRHAIDALPD